MQFWCHSCWPKRAEERFRFHLFQDCDSTLNHENSLWTFSTVWPRHISTLKNLLTFYFRSHYCLKACRRSAHILRCLCKRRSRPKAYSAPSSASFNCFSNEWDSLETASKISDEGPCTSHPERLARKPALYREDLDDIRRGEKPRRSQLDQTGILSKE